ncbi:MAG: hypothetical protein ACRDH2_06415, partial [Anaerolineales bacterium]
NPNGMQQGVRAALFPLGVEDREALVLTSTHCAVDRCPFEAHLVLAMEGGQIEPVYRSFGSSAHYNPTTVTFSWPFHSEYAPLCCPSGTRNDTVGFDPAPGEVGVIASELSVCTEGTLAVGPTPNVVFVVCQPGEATDYELTGQTVVEPAGVGGPVGLQPGMRVRVEYLLKECSILVECRAATITPVAMKITVLSP